MNIIGEFNQHYQNMYVRTGSKYILYSVQYSFLKFEQDSFHEKSDGKEKLRDISVQFKDFKHISLHNVTSAHNLGGRVWSLEKFDHTPNDHTPKFSKLSYGY